jgi:PilZ domain
MLHPFENMDEIDNRRFQRVRVELFGRFMTMKDRAEFPCRTLNMSPGGAVFDSSHDVSEGEKIVVYLDELGRIEGFVSRKIFRGFAMQIEASDRKRQKIAEQLIWLANKSLLNLEDGRSMDRVIPQNPYATLSLNEGHKVPCKIENISLTGAAVHIQIKPLKGDVVALNGQIARVIRVTEQGCALEFPPNSQLGAQI